MKKIIVRNKLYVFMIGLFIVFGLLSIIPLKDYAANQKSLLNYYNDTINECKEKVDADMTEQEQEICRFYLEKIDSTEYNMTAYYGYDFTSNFYSNYISELLILLVIILGSTYFITKYLRNRMIINDINRKSYKKILKKLFLSSWKYALLLPIMLLIAFIFTYIITGNGTNGYSYLENTIFENNVLFYFLVIFVQAFVLTLIHTNVVLIVSRKEHNYILSVIKSYVCIIGILMLVETINTNVIYGIFHSEKFINFNILNIYDLCFSDEVISYIVCTLTALFISFIVVFLIYRNKEKLIIDSEKNDNKNEE
ncbi:MAG: hypothetical protein J5982_02155 [Bacilli bacterium]|nr:hypothetical protein [Bacilli bacterium]